MHKLTIFSFNHNDASQNVVAKMYFTKKQAEAIYANKNISNDIQLVLLSTCYRSDILIWSDKPLKELTLIFKNNLPNFSSCFSSVKTFQGINASLYLLKVSMGLESSIIGETEIIKQIKDSLNLAKEKKRVKKDFLEIFKKNNELNKKMREKFNLNRGSISHAYLAFCQALQICPEKSLILFCGFGDINQKIAKYFHKIDNRIKPNFKMVFFTKYKKTEARDFIKKEKIKKAEIKNYIWLKKYLAKAQCVFFATNTNKQILDNKYISILDLRKEKLIICDLSVPSDCEPKIQKHKNINYFNIKNLDKEVEKNQTKKEQKKKDFLNYAKTNKLFSE